MNITNSMGPITLPCGTPLQTSVQVDLDPFTETRCLLPETKAWSEDLSAVFTLTIKRASQ